MKRSTSLSWLQHWLAATILVRCEAQVAHHVETNEMIHATGCTLLTMFCGAWNATTLSRPCCSACHCASLRSPSEAFHGGAICWAWSQRVGSNKWSGACLCRTKGCAVQIRERSRRLRGAAVSTGEHGFIHAPEATPACVSMEYLLGCAVPRLNLVTVQPCVCGSTV